MLLSHMRCAFVVLACGVVSPLGAQQRPPLSIEASVGGGLGQGGGVRANRTGRAADAMIAWRGRSHARGGPIVAVNAMWQGRRGVTAWCQTQQGGECVSMYPNFSSLGVLGGWEFARGRGPSLRLLTGPGLYVRGLGAGSAGLTGRVDLGTPSIGGVALIGSMRVAVTRGREGTYTLSAVTIGVRVH